MTQLRAFFIIWSGQAVSLFGSRLAQFALIWWLTKTTESPTVLALATMVALLPQALFGPIIGVLVDRWSRRLIMLVADSAVALATLFLGFLFWQGLASVGWVFVVLLVRAIGDTFHWPAMNASTSLMVPEKHLTRVQGMNQTLGGTLRIVAAPMGAVLLELIDVAGIILVDVSTALFAIIPLLFIAIPQPERTPSASRGLASVREELVAGLRYVRQRQALLLIIGTALLVNFTLTPAASLLPILVTSHFRGEALQLAWLQTAMGCRYRQRRPPPQRLGRLPPPHLHDSPGSLWPGRGRLLAGIAPSELLVVAIAGLLSSAPCCPWSTARSTLSCSPRSRRRFRGESLCCWGVSPRSWPRWGC
jgi:MFS transporter, DHA3 family, macrolide efflux protein